MIFYLQLFLWAGIGLIFYTYIGYAMIVYCWIKLRSEKPSVPVITSIEDYPTITIIIPVFNEETVIEEKIKNTLSLSYPEGKTEIFVVTDGSEDKSPEIAGKFPGIKLFHEKERKGKNAAVNRLIPFVTSEITVITDANTLLNNEALLNMARHFKDKSVGGVSGEKKIMSKKEDNASAAGENFYWKYESFLKKNDSALGTVIGAAGELFAIRTSLYIPPLSHVIIEDFFVTVELLLKGYKVKYEPEAYAMEKSSESIDEEMKRKVRISAGGIQAVVHFKKLLNVIKYGVPSFQYISHRVMRWTVAPLCIPVVFILSGILIFTVHSIVYYLIFFCQIVFYILACFGFILRNKKTRFRLLYIPFYFLFMNYSVFAGFYRFIRNKQSAVWDRAVRAS